MISKKEQLFFEVYLEETALKVKCRCGIKEILEKKFSNKINFNPSSLTLFSVHRVMVLP